MPSTSWGRLAVPTPVLALLGMLAAALVAAFSLPLLGRGEWADGVAETSIAVTGAVGLALWLLPSPHITRRGLVRLGTDAAAAGFAFAIPAAELVLPEGGRALGGVAGLLHPVADVLLATLALAVLARSRHKGGLAVAPCVAMTLGAIGLAVSDLMGQAGVMHTRCE